MKSKNLMICFPRSGNNLIRYCVEFLTNCPTCGSPKLVKQSKEREVLDRAHAGYLKLPHIIEHCPKDYEVKVLLLLRNYKECIIRHHIDRYQFPKNMKELNIKKFLHHNCFDDIRSPDNVCAYCENLMAFHNFKGKKILVYYEDMMKHFESELRKIIKFFEFDKIAVKDIDTFFKAQKFHREEALKFYQYNGITKGKKLIYHSKDFSVDQNKIYDAEFEKYLGKELFKKYLGRYCFKFMQEYPGEFIEQKREVKEIGEKNKKE